MATLAALHVAAPTPAVLSAVEALQAVVCTAAAVFCLRTAAAGTGLFRAFWSAFGAGSVLWALAAVALTFSPRSPESVSMRMTSWVLQAGSLALLAGCAMRPDRPRGRVGVTFDAIILAVLVLQTWLYVSIPDILAATNVSRAWLTLVSDARAGLALACCALLVNGARGRWRRTVNELALALVVLFVGGALSNRAWALGLYRAGLWDLPWTLSFAWIGLVARESRHMAVPSTFTPDWRELRRSTVVAVVAISLSPALEFVLTLLLAGETALPPRAAVGRALVGLFGTVTLAVMFVVRQFRIIRWAQREQAERDRALRASEQHLRLALDAARMATWEWDVESGTIQWSGGAQALMGSGPRTAAAFLLLVHPADREVAEALVSDLASGRREDFQSEYRMVVGEQVLWVEGRGRAERDAAGRVALVRGAIVDVTRRKVAEEEARESEERWKRLSEAAFEGLGFSEDGLIIDVNQQLADMLGYPPESLVGRPVLDIIAPASRALVTDVMRAGGPESYELLALRSDGTTMPMEVRARLIHHRGRTIRVTAARDISERERLESELRQAARQWQESFEALSEGVAIVDEHGEVRRMNRSALSTLALQTAPYASLDALAEKEPWAGLAEVWRSLESGRGETREVWDALAQRRWLLGGGRLPREEGADWAVLTFRDITETAALRQRLERGEKLAAMGSLVAGVAHEVRTPLFSISATLDAYEGNLSSPEEQREFTGLLRSQVVRLTHLMSDLLDYGRPPTLRPTLGDLTTVMRHALRACAPLMEESGVTVATEIAEDLPAVARDAARLEQVLHNLLANAIQHAPRGSTVRLNARVAPERRGVEMSIEDEGPGIAAADLEQVFEPFFSRRKGGTGLGLSIVQRLVEGHGGTVSATNRTPRGAAFTVWLPSPQ